MQQIVGQIQVVGHDRDTLAVGTLDHQRTRGDAAAQDVRADLARGMAVRIKPRIACDAGARRGKLPRGGTQMPACILARNASPGGLANGDGAHVQLCFPGEVFERCADLGTAHGQRQRIAGAVDAGDGRYARSPFGGAGCQQRAGAIGVLRRGGKLLRFADHARGQRRRHLHGRQHTRPAAALVVVVVVLAKTSGQQQAQGQRGDTQVIFNARNRPPA